MKGKYREPGKNAAMERPAADLRGMESEERLKDRDGLAKREGRLCGLFLYLCLTALLGGCSLAREEFEEAGEDRLAGVFLTREYLDTGTAQLEINWRGDVSFSTVKSGILGELIWEKEEGHDAFPRIAFEGLEGIGIYSISLWNEACQGNTGYSFSDGVFGEMKVNMGDGCETTETTVYVEPASGTSAFYFNPVYQTPRGEFYVTTGHSVSVELEEGASMSSSLSWEVRKSRNQEETEERVEFTINVVCSGADKPIKLLCVGSDDSVLDVLNREQLERILEEECELRLPAGTDYLIVEKEGADAAILRSICDGDEAFLSWLKPRGDGYLEGAMLPLVWQ